jgi:hypothetical protein
LQTSSGYYGKKQILKNAMVKFNAGIVPKKLILGAKFCENFAIWLCV